VNFGCSHFLRPTRHVRSRYLLIYILDLHLVASLFHSTANMMKILEPASGF
jgi:hypothetical protein